MVRVHAPHGIFTWGGAGSVMPTSRTGGTTRKQRRCNTCGARPCFPCQESHVDRDGVTRWRVMRAFHKGR